METRKVQVTGGSTFTVSIPKDWATDNGVEAGNRVEFHPEGDSLLLSPSTDDERVEGTLDIGGLEGAELTRAVMTMYVSGFDIIALETGRVSADQRRTVGQAAQGLVGLEVIEETGDRVVLQDLLDSAELSVVNAVERMRLVALSMLDDAVAALSEADPDLADGVVQRDDDVDRLWYMVSRVFRSALRSPAAAADVGIPRETCFDYHASARNLERVADHATKIARLSTDVEEVPEDVADALADLRDLAKEIIQMAMDALEEADSDRATELANEARERVRDVDSHARDIDDLMREFEMEPGAAQALGLVVDSLSRSADYGGNIAETALQKAAPAP